MITPELISRVFAEPAPDEGDASFDSILAINRAISRSPEAISFLVECTNLLQRRWREVGGDEDSTTLFTEEALADLLGPSATLVVMGYRLALAERQERELESIAKASN